MNNLPEISPFWHGLITSLIKAVSKTLFCFNVVGCEHIPQKGGVLIVANHKSLWDPPLLGIAIMRVRKKPFFLAKAELFRNKVLGSFLKKTGSIPLKRYSGDVGTLKISLELLNHGEIITMFPEGTRRLKKRLSHFLPGIGFLALKAQVPVVPAFISDFGSFPFGKKVSIIFGQALPYEAFAHLDARELSQKLLERVQCLRDRHPGGVCP